MSSTNVFLSNTFGIIRNRTKKYIEIRKGFLDENKTIKIETTGSSLNDNGNTR